MAKQHQVIVTKDERSWDSIKPTVRDAFRRIGSFLALEDEPDLIRVGDMIEVYGDDFHHSIEHLTANGFSIRINVIEV